jgi:hypothetical protein
VNREQHQRYVAEMERLTSTGQLFVLTLDAVTISALVAQASLALRHPENVGQTANIARESINRIIETIEPVAPEMARAMRDGLPNKARAKA